MKILYGNNLALSAYSSEQSAFTAESVLDGHSRKTWRPSESDGSPSITFSCEAGSDAVCLYNVVADSLTLTIYTSGGAELSSETIDLTVSTDYDDYYVTRVWREFTAQGANHNITVALSASGFTPSMGVAYGGVVRGPFTDPEYGFSEGDTDYSIRYDLDNGFEYIYRRNMGRNVAPGFVFRDLGAYWAFRRLCREIGPDPAVWLLHDTYTPQEEFIHYSCFADQPGGALPAYGRAEIQIALKEYL